MDSPERRDMRKIIVAVLVLTFIACACETTTNGKDSPKKAANGPMEITVGGDITIQGEYQDSH